MEDVTDTGASFSYIQNLGFLLQGFAHPMLISRDVSEANKFVKETNNLKPTSTSIGCLGCCTKPPLIIVANKPSKRLRIRGRTVKKSSISEDFWSTSTCETDNSIVQSQRSGSSMSTSNPPLDPHSSAGSMSNPTEFVNHG
ncbi:hypothetical protein LOK49_LG15G00167 [Camellia lanceoleosa]|uniref:Uncharacterized protein n=1 Tax=Camellia lanceoleosa TaxID=1840588 RepID=A0ACC0F1X4_9ERIC|nr:hypothetical protein LOK49_LG15G00167 [Camellia lanceoleosa]